MSDQKFILKQKKGCFFIATPSGCEHLEIFTDDEKEARWYLDIVNALSSIEEPRMWMLRIRHKILGALNTNTLGKKDPTIDRQLREALALFPQPKETDNEH